MKAYTLYIALICAASLPLLAAAQEEGEAVAQANAEDSQWT